MKRNTITSGLRALLLLVLFSGYYVSNNFFFHAHYLNGRYIVHSHPYSSAEHTHSSNVLSLLHMYNYVLLEKSEEIRFVPQELQLIDVVYACDLKEYYSAEVLSLDPRGPPFFS